MCDACPRFGQNCTLGWQCLTSSARSVLKSMVFQCSGWELAKTEGEISFLFLKLPPPPYYWFTWGFRLVKIHYIYVEAPKTL